MTACNRCGSEDVEWIEGRLYDKAPALHVRSCKARPKKAKGWEAEAVAALGVNFGMKVTEARAFIKKSGAKDAEGVIAAALRAAQP